jgi:hypothetical protein
MNLEYMATFYFLAIQAFVGKILMFEFISSKYSEKNHARIWGIGGLFAIFLLDVVN